jgi:hypothetical protein
MNEYTCLGSISAVPGAVLKLANPFPAETVLLADGGEAVDVSVQAQAHHEDLTVPRAPEFCRPASRNSPPIQETSSGGF